MQPAVVVTGASSGIGAEFSRIIAAEGLRQVLVARSRAALEQLAAEVASHGAAPLVVVLDLAKPDAGAQLAAAMADAGIEPMVIINNAGFGLTGAAGDLPLAAQLEMLDLNVRALADLSLRFLPGLARLGGGVLNVASVAAFMPGPGMATYYASKAFVLSFSTALGKELAAKGVRVTTLCPGPVRTGFQARAGFHLGRTGGPFTLDAAEVARQGWDGFKAGRAVVVPGIANKLLVQMPRLLPRGLLTALSQRALRRPPSMSESA